MTIENDTEMVTELATEVTSPVTPPVTPEDTKKTAKLDQLKRARESAVTKKAKRERDYDDMSGKLDKLTEYMTAKKEEKEIEEPPQKRVRVTKDDTDVGPQPRESWSTAITRVTAVAALSAGGWYFQHVYGKPSVPAVFKKKEEVKKTPPMLSTHAKNRVGKSGFLS
jgi:hypothetical protein